MKKNESVFLVCVFCAAMVIAGLSLRRFGDLLPATGGPVPSGASGKARVVDLEKIRRLIRQGTLSDREALFYSVGPALHPGSGEEPYGNDPERYTGTQESDGVVSHGEARPSVEEDPGPGGGHKQGGAVSGKDELFR